MRHGSSKFLQGPAGQRGVTFIVSMIMLVVLTLVAITALRLSNSDLMITNSFENENEAFVGAENSLQTAERDLGQNFTGAPNFDFDQAGDGYYSAGEIVITSTNWDEVNYENGGVAGAQYVVEYLGPAPYTGGSLSLGAGAATTQQFVYRITGRGSSSKGSVRVTESIFTSTE